MSNWPTSTDLADSPPEKLTISRLMVLTAGVAVGLVVFGPREDDFGLYDVDSWRVLATAMLIGLSLPGVWYGLRRRCKHGRLGAGALLWLTLGLGVLLMLPPAIGGPLLSDGEMGGGQAVSCMYYVMPFVGLWSTLAMLCGGMLRCRHLGRRLPWTERFGRWLGLAFSPLGIWLLVDFYIDAFF